MLDEQRKWQQFRNTLYYVANYVVPQITRTTQR